MICPDRGIISSVCPKSPNDVQVEPPDADPRYVNNSRTRRRNPAAIVRATCPTCGDIELTVEQVQVQVCVTTGESTYSFLCPCCAFIVNKDANDSVVESLTSAGSRLVAWTLPAELSEPKSGPRITHDDLLEFHLALESTDWESDLASLIAKG
jgi:hypothetical protein